MKINHKFSGYVSYLTIASFFSMGVAHATIHEYKCFPQNGSFDVITFPVDKPVVTFNFNDDTKDISVPSPGIEIQGSSLKDSLPRTLLFTYTYCKISKYLGRSKTITNSFSMLKDPSQENLIKNQERWQLTYTPDKYWKLQKSQHLLKCHISRIEPHENKVPETEPVEKCASSDAYADINQENANIIKDWSSTHPASNPPANSKANEGLNSDTTHPASVQYNLEDAHKAFNTPFE